MHGRQEKRVQVPRQELTEYSRHRTGAMTFLKCLQLTAQMRALPGGQYRDQPDH